MTRELAAGDRVRLQLAHWLTPGRLPYRIVSVTDGRAVVTPLDGPEEARVSFPLAQLVPEDDVGVLPARPRR